MKCLCLLYISLEHTDNYLKRNDIVQQLEEGYHLQALIIVWHISTNMGQISLMQRPTSSLTSK